MTEATTQGLLGPGPSPVREAALLAGGAAVVREILFPSDLSRRSDRAFEHARSLAVRVGARLTLYHVVETPEGEGAAELSAEEREIARRAEEAARAHLARVAHGLRVPYDIVVERAAAAREALVARIRGTRPDLTVMATHGREGLSHLFLGSVTETALARGSGPILCIREPDHGVALAYRRILVPTDLSEASRRAFPLAALLARVFGAEVLAVHVAALPEPGSLYGIPEIVESALPSEEDVRAFLGGEFEDVALTVHVDVGSPWDRLVDIAGAEKADVIVMSTHGHDSLADRVLGSHAERMVRHAPCPVLVMGGTPGDGGASEPGPRP